MLPLFIIAPLLALIVLNLPSKRPLAQAAVALGLLLAAAQVALAIWFPPQAFTSGGYLSRYFSFGLGQCDQISRLMLLTIGLVVFVTLLVARGTLKTPRDLHHFVSVLLVAVIGMNGMSLVRDLFALYVFLEIVAVSSFILIALHRGRDALEGTFKYIILSAVASVLIVAAIALLLLVTGSSVTTLKEAQDVLRFDTVHNVLQGNTHLLVKLALGAFLCGVFIKGGLVPFHGWVLGAYSAGPAATSVLLAGIGTKIAGVYALIRLMTDVIGQNPAIDHILLLVGAISAVIGALAALGQTDLKRLLAYSSISQVGYILLGLGCGSTLGLMGALFHFFNHAIFKSQLFVNSAALEESVGSTDMSRMGGLGSRMPWTNVTATLAALSTAGVPPLSGFWSKLIIIVALWQASFHVYAMLAVAVSVLTLGYMLAMQRKVFFGQTAEAMAEVREARVGLIVPAVLLAAITVGVGAAVPFVPYIMDALKMIVPGK